MSCIVFQTNPKTGIQYAYESFSYWDKEKKQPRSRRKYLGRVDPQTGEIIRSRRGKQPLLNAADGQETTVPPTIMELQKELTAKNTRISQLEKELAALSKKYEKARETLTGIATLINSAMENARV